MNSSNTRAFSTIVDNLVFDDLVEYHLSVVFAFGNGKKYQFPSEQIISLNTTRDYRTKYRPTAELIVQCSAEEALAFHASHQDLKLQIVLRRTNAMPGDALYFEYMAILRNQGDPDLLLAESSISKSTKSTPTADLIRLEFELVGEFEYHLRKTRVNMILRNATMAETITAVAQELGFKQIYLVPPDNAKVYRNMVIPPLSSIETVFGLLQRDEKYGGVYRSGLGYFVQNTILYVYPLLEPYDHTRQLICYNAPKNLFYGAGATHRVTGNRLELAVVDPMITTDLSRHMEEARGSAVAILSNNQILDNAYLLQGNEVVGNRDFITNILLQKEILGVGKTAYNQVYKVSNNHNEIMAALYSNAIYQVTIPWKGALYGALNPSYSVSLLADTKKGLKVQHGVLASASYELIRTPNNHNAVFTCMSLVNIIVSKLT